MGDVLQLPEDVGRIGSEVIRMGKLLLQKAAAAPRRLQHSEDDALHLISTAEQTLLAEVWVSQLQSCGK